ncbi:MAG TPA: ATP-binding cassette domain-containing protein [Solirubrobacteraceae bacterium]|nr:ATP-binding cassette domain-containing protein [Solirubrobacteraceae bacterium]
MTAAIEANELIKKYPPDVTALDGVSLAVEPGSIFGLLGPNGAGKSTTVRILTALSQPDSGSVRVAGHDAASEAAAVRRAIGVVGQKHGADPEATGRENLVLQGEFYGITGADLRERVRTSLQTFGLESAADRQVKTYSGGMARRLDVAMGLLHRPRVLFMDEPTTGLDPEARLEMWSGIEALAREEEITILLTTHYMEEADSLASQIAIIDHGRVVAEGTPEGLKSDLRGDTIHIELAGREDDRAAGALADVDGVSDVTRDGRTLHARVADGGAAIPGVLAALSAAGSELASVTVARPSLDEVYLRYAGHAYAAEDEGGQR